MKRYAVIESSEAWLVVDLPLRDVKARGLVVASCASPALADKVCTAMERAFGRDEA